MPAPHEWNVTRLKAAYRKMPRPVGTQWGVGLGRLPPLPPLRSR